MLLNSLFPPCSLVPAVYAMRLKVFMTAISSSPPAGSQATNFPFQLTRPVVKGAGSKN
jgi:hypothetical protein